MLSKMQVGFTLWLILLAVICGSFLLNDHYSCQRSQGTRAALRISYNAATTRTSGPLRKSDRLTARS